MDDPKSRKTDSQRGKQPRRATLEPKPSNEPKERSKHSNALDPSNPRGLNADHRLLGFLGTLESRSRESCLATLKFIGSVSPHSISRRELVRLNEETQEAIQRTKDAGSGRLNLEKLMQLEDCLRKAREEKTALEKHLYCLKKAKKTICRNKIADNPQSALGSSKKIDKFLFESRSVAKSLIATQTARNNASRRYENSKTMLTALDKRIENHLLSLRHYNEMLRVVLATAKEKVTHFKKSNEENLDMSNAHFSKQLDHIKAKKLIDRSEVEKLREMLAELAEQVESLKTKDARSPCESNGTGEASKVHKDLEDRRKKVDSMRTRRDELLGNKKVTIAVHRVVQSVLKRVLPGLMRSF